MTLRVDRSEFDDLDRFVESLTGWETEPTQLSAGPLGLVAESVGCEEFGILRLALSPRVADRSTVHRGTVGFVLAERPQIWCGVEVAPPAVIAIGPGRENRSILEPGFRSLEFYFDEGTVARHRLGRRLAPLGFAPERSVFPVTDRHAHALRGAAAELFDPVVAVGLGARHDDLLGGVRDRLLDLLDAIAAPWLRGPGPFVLPRPTWRARHGLALAALGEVGRAGAVGLTPPDLARRFRVTRRALEQAFRSVVGVSPGQYLLAQRLTAARRLLRADGRSVLDCALESGFHDSSRFARQYRRLFGELPSRTLERARGHRSGVIRPAARSLNSQIA